MAAHARQRWLRYAGMAISLHPKGRDADNLTHPSGLILSRTVADGAAVPAVVVWTLLMHVCVPKD